MIVMRNWTNKEMKMTTLRMLAVVLVLGTAALALLPVAMMGAVYAVLTACVLLSLVPLAVENLLTVEIKGGNKR